MNFWIKIYFPLSYVMIDPGDFALSGAVWVFLLTGIAGYIPTGGLAVCFLCFAL